MFKQVVVVAGLLLIAGCGGSGDDTDRPSRFTKDNFSQKMTAALLAEGTMHVEMQVDAGSQQITMSGDQVMGRSIDDSAMSMTYSESGEDGFEMRLVDGIFYANFGESSEGKFVRVDPKDPASPIGETLAPMADELDLTKSIREFADAITEVEQQGDGQRIDGVGTTPYKVTLDVDRAIESGALEKDTQLRPGASVVYTFYIDADDRVRRMESSVDSAHVRMDVTNLGEPVEIDAPPASQVIDESAFTGG